MTSFNLKKIIIFYYILKKLNEMRSFKFFFMKNTLMLFARGYIHGINNGANMEYKCQYLIKRK